MEIQSRAILATLLVAVFVSLGVRADAASCEPYCDRTTIKTANSIDGRGHGGWLATVLDQYGYRAQRWAEITRVPAGQGKRAIGIIHVPVGKAPRARQALAGWWFVQRGTVFVLPLVTRYNTQGGTGSAFEEAARRAKRLLGPDWKLRTP